MVSRVISVCNLKGGTGKTTTVLNLGAALANKGKRVLLVDLDAQGNLSESLGKDTEAVDRDIYRALRNETALEPIEIYAGLHLVPATLDLAAADAELSADSANGVFVLKELLEGVRDRYDFVLIDCSPSIGALVVSALIASDSLIIPLQAEYLPLRGLKKLTEVISKVQRRNKELKVIGILVTQYDSRKILSRNVLESVQEHFRAEVFDSRIRNNVALAESPSRGVDIFRYEPKSNGAEDYAALCEEVLRRYE